MAYQKIKVKEIKALYDKLTANGYDISMELDKETDTDYVLMEMIERKLLVIFENAKRRRINDRLEDMATFIRLQGYEVFDGTETYKTKCITICRA